MATFLFHRSAPPYIRHQILYFDFDSTILKTHIPNQEGFWTSWFFILCHHIFTDMCVVGMLILVTLKCHNSSYQIIQISGNLQNHGEHLT
jgi:hypothetical protein